MTISKTPRFKPHPTRGMYPNGLTEAWDEWYKDTAKALDGGEIDTLICLVRHGPVYDGDVPSKAARDTLLNLKLAAKIVVSGDAMPKSDAYKYIPRPSLILEEETRKYYAWGYQAATYSGAYVYKALLELGLIKP